MNTAFGPLLNPSSPSSWVTDIYSNCPRKRPLSFINWILVSERLPYLWLDAQDAQDAGVPHFPTLFESFELVHPEALKPSTVLRPVAYGHLAGTAATARAAAAAAPGLRSAAAAALCSCRVPSAGRQAGVPVMGSGAKQKISQNDFPICISLCASPPKKKQTNLPCSQ